MRAPTLLLAILLSLPAFAGTPADRELALRHAAVALVNLTPESVQAVEILAEWHRQLRQGSRFEPHAESSEILQRRLLEHPRGLGTSPIAPALDGVADLFPALIERGADCAYLGVLEREGADGSEYRIRLWLVALATGEPIGTALVTVRNRLSLMGYASAAREAIFEVWKGIPFDGSVLRREGLRLVLDRGSPTIRHGALIPLYQLERETNGVYFRLRGRARVTRADASLSFAEVAWEPSPGAVAVGNKFRARSSDVVAWPDWEQKRRVPVGPPRLGSVAAIFEGGVTRLHAVGVSGSGTRSGEAFLPGGKLAAELWITPRWTLAAAMSAQLSRLRAGTTDIATSVSRISLDAAYVARPLPHEPRAEFRATLGYLRQAFGADDTSAGVALPSLLYQGVRLAGGVRFPVTGPVSVGMDLGMLLFPSVREAGAIISRATDPNAWDFSLQGGWEIESGLHVEGRLLLQRFSSAFGGASALASASQSTTGMGLGLRKEF